MRNIICLVLTICVIMSLSACSFEQDPNYTPPEQPHLYWKDIDVEVTNVDKRQWFATVHRRIVNITVYSEEYNLTKTLTYEDSGMWINNPAWEYKKGDVIKAQLYSWVMDSTGEVVKRDINKIY